MSFGVEEQQESETTRSPAEKLSRKLLLIDFENVQQVDLERIDSACKTDKKSRPRRRKTLSQHIASMFQNKLEQPEVDRIIDLLFANKMVSEMNSTITYEF